VSKAKPHEVRPFLVWVDRFDDAGEVIDPGGRAA
jgi:hypothetical protein